MIRYRSGYKYQISDSYSHNVGISLAEEVDLDFLTLDPTGNLVIKQGYAWDGPSGPALDTSTLMRASLVHDALYQLMRMERLPDSYRDHADDLMRKICIEAGMPTIRAWYTYHAVRWFASGANKPRNVKPVLSAP